jgi:hypothetical protein
MEPSTGKALQAAIPHAPPSAEDNPPQGEITTTPPVLQPKSDQILEKALEEIQRFFKRLRKDLTDNAREKAELRQAYLEIEQLGHHIRQQGREIEQYRSEVFESITTFDISDRWIADELASIHGGLANWVEDLPEPDQNGCKWEAIKQFMDQRKYVTALRGDCCRETADGAQEEFLMHVVLRILWAHMLGLPCIGLTTEQHSFLAEVYSSLELMQPQKGENVF